MDWLVGWLVMLIGYILIMQPFWRARR